MAKTNYAIPRGTKVNGDALRPRDFHDDRPFGLRPWWQQRTTTQREQDDRWRHEYAASLRDRPTYRVSNVLTW